LSDWSRFSVHGHISVLIRAAFVPRRCRPFANVGQPSRYAQMSPILPGIKRVQSPGRARVGPRLRRSYGASAPRLRTRYWNGADTDCHCVVGMTPWIRPRHPLSPHSL
jgi:hypothetical protein